MKKIIIILLSLSILFSCTKVQEKDEIVTNSGEIVAQTGALIEESNPSEELVEDSTKNELINITHENFKPLIASLKKMDKESLKDINCETYIYLSELENRPDYQVEIYNDYMKQCKEIVDNSNK
ncbi:MAG: hypothetical protein PHI37_05790 [Candidatus Gracilibacteria bacterium]|nr:hypothetical protein [Candidatus Gracilibacteria bacterium]